MLLTLDIGGSKVAAGIVKGGKVLNFQKFSWQGKITRQKFLNQIIQIISDFPATAGPRLGGGKLKIKNCDVIAISIAGQVNRRGEVFLSRNLIKNKTKISLRKILKKKFHLPVFVENDANCFTLSEAVFGQGKGKKLVLGLTLGSGIGGGIVLDKKIIHGKDGYAGELGHMVIEAGGEKCSCGKRGCFEVYASVTALKKFYFQLSGKKISGFMIDEAFKRKDKKAIFAAQKVADYLAIGLGNMIDIFDPDIIVLGGGLSRFKKLMKMAIKKTKNWVLAPENKTKIVLSKLKEKATLLGVSLLATTQLSN